MPFRRLLADPGTGEQITRPGRIRSRISLGPTLKRNPMLFDQAVDPDRIHRQRSAGETLRLAFRKHTIFSYTANHLVGQAIAASDESCKSVAEEGVGPTTTTNSPRGSVSASMDLVQTTDSSLIFVNSRLIIICLLANTLVSLAMVLSMRCGPQRRRWFDVSAVSLSIQDVSSVPDLGAKPMKTNSLAGNPETERAAMMALGPGIGTTRTPFRGPSEPGVRRDPRFRGYRRR